MALRQQDILPVFLHYLGLSEARLLLGRLRRKPIVRFVAFHDIPTSATDAFRQKAQLLKERANVISIDDYLADKLSTIRVNVAVTFDDGYKSWLTVAAPVLKALEMPATFFISSGFIGLSGIRETEFVQSRLNLATNTTGSLTNNDLRSLAKQGFSIGGHTRNHVNLAKLAENGIRQEITKDREALEEIINQPVSHFAYPFGAAKHPSLDLAKVVEQSGYRTAVTTRSGCNTETTNRYALHRELTGAQMSKRAFVSRIHGNQDAVRLLKSAAAIAGTPFARRSGVE